MRGILSDLKSGVAPGCGGLRPEYATILGQYIDDEGMDLTEEFGMAYLRGDLPAWFYRVVQSVQTVGLYKTDGGLRPLGMKHTFIKCCHKEVFIQNKQAIMEYLQPLQLGQSKGGAAKLIFSVRALLDANPEFVCIRLDLKNAYNEQFRRAIIDVCQSIPALRHLAHFLAITLAPFSGMEYGGVLWGETGEGVAQGDPASSFEFCLGVQPSLETLNKEASEDGRMA